MKNNEGHTWWEDGENRIWNIDEQIPKDMYILVYIYII